MQYLYGLWGVDGLSRFSFKAQTHRLSQTQLLILPTRLGYFRRGLIRATVTRVCRPAAALFRGQVCS